MRILFVCLGNICRSPLAHGIFQHLAEDEGRDDLIIDSAGTGAWHVGKLPDPRSIEVAAKYGIDLTDQRARQVRISDFDDFDLILAMDDSNLANLQSMKPAGSKAEVALFLDYTLGGKAPVTNVPDPYYGGDDGFEYVYNLVFSGAKALLERIN